MKIKWLRYGIWITNVIVLTILVIFSLNLFSPHSQESKISEIETSGTELESDTEAGHTNSLSLEDYSLIWKRFAPETPPAEPEAPPLKLELLELKLKGTIIEKDMGLAVISDHKGQEHLLKVGDEIEGASVLEVTPTKVILGYQGHRVALYLKPDEEDKRAEGLPAKAR